EPSCIFNITHLSWVMPKINPQIDIKSNLIKMIANKNTNPIGFIYRKLEKFNVPHPTTTFTWQLGPKSATEQPKYFIIGFQSNRYNNFNDAGVFDNCSLTNLNVYINEVQYPN